MTSDAQWPFLQLRYPLYLCGLHLLCASWLPFPFFLVFLAFLCWLIIFPLLSLFLLVLPRVCTGELIVESSLYFCFFYWCLLWQPEGSWNIIPLFGLHLFIQLTLVMAYLVLRNLPDTKISETEFLWRNKTKSNLKVQLTLHTELKNYQNYFKSYAFCLILVLLIPLIINSMTK